MKVKPFWLFLAWTIAIYSWTGEIFENRKLNSHIDYLESYIEANGLPTPARLP